MCWDPNLICFTLLTTTGAGDAALTSEINLLLKLYEWKNIKCP